jgi:2-oxoglutarate dehydrogenase E2 component (dihydrolipoamide succinyltransferase)
MALDVKVPAVGESVTEAMIHKWHKQSGDFVERDEVLLELETDKATVEVVAESSGKLEVVRKQGETVKIGDVVARLDTDAKSEGKPAAAKAETAKQTASAPAATHNSPTPESSMPLSPAVRKMVTEQQIDPSSISGTGRGGRLTKGDVLTAAASAQPATTPAKPEIKIAPATTSAASVSTSGARGERREPMSMLRRRVAERLVQSQQTTAMLTTFNEVDMSAVMKMRAQYKEPFEKRYGTPLGFMGFFLKATIEGLKQFPQLNGWIEGNDIVYHDYCDIGVAVSTERGLVVPVIRNVQTMAMSDIELAIAGFAKKAREGKISVDDMSGGTFTVSNGGVFGSLMSTPILNPPQSGILGMHKIQERPVVVDGQVVVRPMMYLALSYDHRIVDGKEAVQFLVKIKNAIEDPSRLLLGV